MIRTLLAPAGTMLLLAACTAMPPVQHQSRAVIDACLDELQHIAGQELAPEADRAYVYAKEDHYWVYFTHGDLGTFGRRSADYQVLLDCGALYGSPPETLFLGEPMQEPLLDTPGRDYFVTPAGSTELRFIRTDSGFEYCCSQPFKRTNLFMNNPTL